jgi:preprotein translocase subunit SecD
VVSLSNNDESASTSASADAIELRQVVSGEELNGQTCPPARSSPEKATLCTTGGRASVELGPIIVDGADVLSAEAIQPFPGEDQWSVLISLNEQGTQDFAAATGVAATSPPPANLIGIVADDIVISIAQVDEAITSGQIEAGGLTQAEAEDLAAQFE